jgi:hypothetical protein
MFVTQPPNLLPMWRRACWGTGLRGTAQAAQPRALSQSLTVRQQVIGMPGRS